MVLIEEWYKKYQDHIVAVYLYGSRVNPYVHNPDDYDYIVFAKNDDSYRLLYSHRHELEQYKIHIIVINAETFEHKPNKIGDYLFNYIAPIIGYFNNANYNILYVEDEYRDVLRSLAPHFPYMDPEKPGLTNKRWYHIIQGLFILDNFSYTLTAEQEKIINLVHQGKCPREWYEWACNKLGLKAEQADPKPEQKLSVKPKRFVIRNGKKVWL